MRTGEGCGNAGPVESVEKQKRLSHSFHHPLEISQTTRDFHIPTARLRDGGCYALKLQADGKMIELRSDDRQDDVASTSDR
jgi:hypothetical protein